MTKVVSVCRCKCDTCIAERQKLQPKEDGSTVIVSKTKQLKAKDPGRNNYKNNRNVPLLPPSKMRRQNARIVERQVRDVKREMKWMQQGAGQCCQTSSRTGDRQERRKQEDVGRQTQGESRNWMQRHGVNWRRKQPDERE